MTDPDPAQPNNECLGIFLLSGPVALITQELPES